MIVVWLLLTLAWITPVIWAYPTEGLFVSEDTDQCDHKGTILFCDFKNNQQDIVYTKPLKSRDIEKIFIYSANELHINEDLCSNIALHNVQKTIVHKSNGTKCEKSFKLDASKTNFGSLRSSASEIHLEQCKLEELFADNLFSKLTVIKSEIKVLNVNVTGEFKSDFTVLLQDSQVKTLEKLVASSESTLLIQNSHIDIIEPSGLEHFNGSVTIESSSIRKIKKGTLEIDNFHGDVTFRRITKNNKSAPDKISECECRQSNVFKALYIVLLMLLISSWIFFLLYINKKAMFKMFSSKTQGLSNMTREHGNTSHNTEETQNLTDQTQENTEEKVEEGNKDSSRKIRPVLNSDAVECIRRNLKELETKLNTQNTQSAGGIAMRQEDSPGPANEAPKVDSELLSITKSNLDMRVSYLSNVYGQIGSLKHIFTTSKNFNILDIYPLTRDFFGYMVNLPNEVDSQYVNSGGFTDAIEKWEKEYTELNQHLGSPVEVSDLKTKAKEIEKQNAANPSESQRKMNRFWQHNKSKDRNSVDETGEDAAQSLADAKLYFYIIPQELVAKFHAISLASQKTCLRQYTLLLDKKIHYIETLLEILLRSHIAYLKFVLDTSGNSVSDINS